MQIPFMKSNLRLVVNLHECVKAQHSAAYANKVKLSNLKEKAEALYVLLANSFEMW